MRIGERDEKGYMGSCRGDRDFLRSGFRVYCLGCSYKSK